GGAVTGRQLHHAEAIAMRLEPHGLGVDRHRAALVVEEIGQVAAVQADGHGGPWGGGMNVGPRRGAETPRLAALVPETRASANSPLGGLGGMGGGGAGFSKWPRGAAFRAPGPRRTAPVQHWSDPVFGRGRERT